MKFCIDPLILVIWVIYDFKSALILKFHEEKNTAPGRPKLALFLEVKKFQIYGHWKDPWPFVVAEAKLNNTVH